MDAHRRTCRKRGADQLVGCMQLIKRMPALMNNGVHRKFWMFRIIMCCNTYIVLAEVRGKWMLRFTDGTVVLIDADHIHQIIGEYFLLRNGIILMQKTVVHLYSLRLNAAQKRYDFLTKAAEKDVELRLCESLFISREPYVIRRLLRLVVSGKADKRFNNAVNIRREGGEIIFHLCAVPDAFCIAAKFSERDILILRNLAYFVIVAFHNLRLFDGERVELLPVCKNCLKQFSYLGRCEQFIVYAA